MLNASLSNSKLELNEQKISNDQFNYEIRTIENY